MRPVHTRVPGRRVDLVAAAGLQLWTVGMWRLRAAADAATGAGDECWSARCSPAARPVRWRGPVISRWSRHSRRTVDEALGDRVRPRCPDWGADDGDVG